MRFTTAITSAKMLLPLFLPATTVALPTSQIPILSNAAGSNHTITPRLFSELEELARIVDISYCVGMTGIQKPFQCLSRCNDFPNFELVTTWNTGVLMSDSCGYIALDHSLDHPRIILAFRGTYSLANTIADLSTVPQEYVPYFGEDNSTTISPHLTSDNNACPNCTVHAGFLRSWRNTRDAIIPILDPILALHPTYSLTLVGHSLGGAVALLAGLEFLSLSWQIQVTTFGEPRVGNAAFVTHVNERFAEQGAYRRVTHVDDPVPLLPLTEWGFRPHAGELYIPKASLPPDIADVRTCDGDVDLKCSAGADSSLESPASKREEMIKFMHRDDDDELVKRGLIPARYKLWQLFFAHRDYFWRLGVCLKTGDPWDWIGGRSGREEEEEL